MSNHGWPEESDSDVIKSLICARNTLERECHREHDKNVALTDRVKSLEAAMKIAHQALAHAQAVGANWYTRGASGLYQQVAMWVRKGREAIAAQHL